jgi:NAD(P)-dependent dehydrogenase (short-subunit alcohol dehydrogenase family)
MFAERFRLDGRHVVVLGAGQGIGRAAARGAAELGARLTCVDLAADRAEAIAREVGGVSVAADVTRRVDVERVFAAAVQAHGPVRHVLDVVGIPRNVPLPDMTDEMWDFQFDIVLRHALLAIQLGVPAMHGAVGGSFVFVSSISGLGPSPMHTGYAAAKAALISLVASEAVRLAPLGIRVNAVAPLLIATPRMKELLGEEGRKLQAGRLAMGRLGEPDEVAAAMLFLASDLASYVSGQTLVISGGGRGGPEQLQIEDPWRAGSPFAEGSRYLEKPPV